MAVVVEGFRWAVLGAPAPQLFAVVITLVITVLLLLLSTGYFRMVERRFADVI